MSDWAKEADKEEQAILEKVLFSGFYAIKFRVAIKFTSSFHTFIHRVYEFK